MSVFTAEQRINANTNPKDWAYELGLLPQSTSIVFTKSSLISFLKTHGIEVGPNNAEISKLPRYALIGKMEEKKLEMVVAVEQARSTLAQVSSQSPPQKEPSPPNMEYMQEDTPVPVQSAATTKQSSWESSQSAKTAPAPAPAHVEVKRAEGTTFRPTRRVREPIGGGSAQIGALFGDGSDDHDEAVREAEREHSKRRGISVPEPVYHSNDSNNKPVERKVTAPLSSSGSENQPANEQKADIAVFKPTRRVREPGGTGGTSSITLG